MSTPFKIRRPVPSDVEYMLKTWLRTQRKAMSLRCPDRIFYNEYQKVILTLVRRSDARVICSAEDPNYIAGFVVGTVYSKEKYVHLHFAYIRSVYRRTGLATKALIDMGYVQGFELIATHWGPGMDNFIRKDLIYNPFSLYSVNP